jgi:sirohydrochlorin cobaltochelatase
MNKPCIILMPHGSKNPQWSEPFCKLTANLRQTLGQEAVYLAFMELSTPDLMDAAREMMRTGTRKGRILPMFMAKGNHFKDDIPEQIARVRSAYPELELELLDPIGLNPVFFELMGNVIQNLYAENQPA